MLKSALFLGRGSSFPIAMEGALKLKEITYIHAEGYASGEMKHGPIALVDDKVPVVIISPKDSLFEKNISNMQEIMARGGKVLLVTDKNGEKSTKDIVVKIVLPNVDEFVQPILYSIPMQLIAYFVAVKKVRTLISQETSPNQLPLNRNNSEKISNLFLI